MFWTFVVGVIALIALLLSAVLFATLVRVRRRSGFVTDGDFVATLVESEETETGIVTVYRVDEPVDAKGRLIRVTEEIIEPNE